jgi:hypothetical protein
MAITVSLFAMFMVVVLVTKLFVATHAHQATEMDSPAHFALKSQISRAS